MRELGLFALFIGALLTGIIVLVYWGYSTSCYQIAEQMHVRHQFGFFTDCMIEIDGQWVPLSKYRKL